MEGEVRGSKGKVRGGWLCSDIVGLTCGEIRVIKDGVILKLLLECSASSVGILCGEPCVVVCVEIS